MKTFNRIVLVSALLFVAFNLYLVIDGVLSHRICLNTYCARMWVEHQGFFPIAFLYCLLAMTGLGFARSAYARIQDLSKEP